MSLSRRLLLVHIRPAGANLLDRSTMRPRRVGTAWPEEKQGPVHQSPWTRNPKLPSSGAEIGRTSVFAIQHLIHEARTTPKSGVGDSGEIVGSEFFQCSWGMALFLGEVDNRANQRDGMFGEVAHAGPTRQPRCNSYRQRFHSFRSSLSSSRPVGRQRISKRQSWQQSRSWILFFRRIFHRRLNVRLALDARK